MGRSALIFFEYVIYPLAFLLGAAGLLLSIGDAVAVAASLVFISFFAALKYFQIYTDISKMKIHDTELVLEGLSAQYRIPARKIVAVYFVQTRAIMIKVQDSRRMFLLEYHPSSELAKWLKQHNVEFKWGAGPA